MAKQFISELEHGGRVASAFSVKYKHAPREYANGKGFMFIVGAADKTGEIEVTYWGSRDLESVRKIYAGFEDGDVIFVSGTVGRFRDRLKIDINEGGQIRKCAPGEYRIEDFIQSSNKNLDEMMGSLNKIIDSLKNAHLKNLLTSIFRDANFAEKFKAAPAAMYIHHAYAGGLLEHTLDVAALCERINEVHALDRDLLITGAILHDIGKVGSFKVTTNIKESEEGMLRGHIVIGDEMVAEKIKALKDFPENLKVKVSHIIVSHHGRKEYGSPEEPKFAEAAAVYYADECDSKIYQYLNVKERAKSDDFRAYDKWLGEVYLK